MDKANAFVRELRASAPGREVLPVVAVVEKGQISTPRPGLEQACRQAREIGGMVAAPDASRFIRAEAYDRQRNRDAVPTPAEFAKLYAIADGVPLATLKPPNLTEDQRHSEATRATGKAGRPKRGVSKWAKRRRPTIDKE
jgi:hypothetical protein